MGQRNVVNVSRIIAAGTIEEKIEKMKREKKALVKEILDGESMDIMKLEKRELLELLKG